MAGSRRVLVIEDDVFLRGLLADILESRGFAVFQAADAKTALSLIDEQDPDALIVDLDLGHGPSGVEVIESLGERIREFGVLVLSNYPSPSAVSPGATLPESVGYLLKRKLSDAAEVIAALEAVLADSSSHRVNYHESVPRELANLTPGQFEILRLIAMGYSNEMIASSRGVTVRSVESLVNRLFVALSLSSDSRSNARVKAAMLYARAMGIPRDAS
jgi:DNA-binding NarL/FixJ family response regulator